VKVLVSLEHRFIRTLDGRVWTTTVGNYNFWRRYLAIFDGVTVLARVRAAATRERGWQQADGPGVCFYDLPNYVGPSQYVVQAWSIRRRVASALEGQAVVIMRVPSRIGYVVWRELRRQMRPFGLEVVGDPFDVFSPGAVHHPLRAIFRWTEPRSLREMCRTAAAASYVTESALQRRYPTFGHEFGVSDVELPDEAFVVRGMVSNPDNPRTRQSGPECPAGASCPLMLVTVGGMGQMYKGYDVLLGALYLCLRRGFDLQLTLVGDGAFKEHLEALARRIGVHGRCHFLGELPGGRDVRNILDLADLFVLPSRQEGMPRALLEAMARGLPCVATNVGGIPEVLANEDLVRPNDASALAEKLCSVLASSSRLSSMSERNMCRATDFAAVELAKRRGLFYSDVRTQTERWMAEHRGRVPACSR
jgi:glycosyltransferase involved in cell wall biosynthesis